MYLIKSSASVFRKCYFVLVVWIISFSTSSAQLVLFDFNSAPIHTSLPLDQTAGGITAHLSATGQGFSIQDYFGNNFVPIGFSGLFICPNSIYAADLLIRFDQTLTDFSIMYSPEEYGCDTSATMRVTAYMSGSYVGTSTKVASIPGTWPVDTLRCSFSRGFDSVVVHYDSHPSTGCSDWGPIFAADNMRVTASTSTVTSTRQQAFSNGFIIPNPITKSAIISFSLSQSENINLTIYDITGRLIKNIYDGPLNAGEHQIRWNVNDNSLNSGVYFLKLTGKNISQTHKLVVVK